MYGSGNIDVDCTVLLVALHVAILNQAADALLNHRWLRLEERDSCDNFLNEVSVGHCLVSLHDLDDLAVARVMPLLLNDLLCRLLFLLVFSSIWLSADSLGRNDTEPSLVVRELHVDANLFIWCECGLV